MAVLFPTPSDFVQKLLSGHEGEIIVCNILDGREAGLYGDDEIKLYFDWWMALCEHIGASDLRSILAVMDKLTPNGLPPDFRPSVARPDFLFICRRQHRRPSGTPTISAVLPAFVVRGKSTLDSCRRLAVKGGCVLMMSTRSDWAEDDVRSFLSIPDSERYVEIQPGAEIGNEILWVTITDRLKAAIARAAGKADAARDILGLSHRRKPDVLVALHFPWRGVDHRRSGRPTFMDARVHNRFMSLPRRAANRKARSWGRTLDLGAVPRRRLKDGLPERVCCPIDHSVLTDRRIEFTPLGRLEESRASSRVDDDCAYSRLLRGSRTCADLYKDLVDIL